MMVRSTSQKDMCRRRTSSAKELTVAPSVHATPRSYTESGPIREGLSLKRCNLKTTDTKESYLEML
ncbi:unnamed protein product [Ectocarpus sp. CCAP 1310/34]|nr:unnamed protein product [Ectocarpus sp. CCAP 1310/34]